jgi:ubiquinone/menaquinone biosynthesis C-methylase UbiE
MISIKTLSRVCRLLGLLAGQQLSRARLPRIPEPSAVPQDDDHVGEYNRALRSKLAVVYACALELIDRARSGRQGGTAIDLACGPGHFSLCLAHFLGYDSVTGIDLAPAMVECAGRNACLQNVTERARFVHGDVTRLNELATASVDLASFTYAAHHLPDLQAVTQVLREMDRITRGDGVIFVLDLVRLRTSRLTDRYVEAAAAEYRGLGLPHLLSDFRASMYAAWSAEELGGVIPRRSGRRWCHIVPRGLPLVQVILGVPASRRGAPMRPPGRTPLGRALVPAGMIPDWRILRWALRLGSCTEYVRGTGGSANRR